MRPRKSRSSSAVSQVLSRLRIRCQRAPLPQSWDNEELSLCLEARAHFKHVTIALLCAGLPFEHLPEVCFWKTRPVLLLALRQVVKRGFDSPARARRAGFVKLERALVRHFGSWQAARRSIWEVEQQYPLCPLLEVDDPGRGERILARLRELSDDEGVVYSARIPVQMNFQARQHFGSLPAACAQAGVRVQYKLRYRTREDVLEVLRQRAHKGAVKLSRVDDVRHTFGRLFGSFAQACREAGVSPARDKVSKYSLEEALSVVVEVTLRMGRPAGRKDEGIPGVYKRLTRELGTWAAVLEAARERASSLGLTWPTRQGPIPLMAEDVLARLADLARDGLVHGPDAEPIRYFCKKHFGSVNAACRSAGLRLATDSRALGPDRILEICLEWAARLGQPPTRSELVRRNRSLDTSVRRTFGDWPAAFAAARARADELGQVWPEWSATKEDVVQELLGLALEIGRLPTVAEAEHRKEGLSGRAWHAFGSFRTALFAARRHELSLELLQARRSESW